MVQIKMPGTYWAALNDALNITISFRELKFERALNLVVERSYTESFVPGDIPTLAESLHYALFNEHKITMDNPTKLKELQKTLEAKNGEYDIPDDDLKCLTRSIDFAIRMVLGQWQELNWLYMNYLLDGKRFWEENNADAINMVLGNIRNKAIPLFDKYDIRSLNASFGIYSPHLAKSIGYMYGIYKAMEFSLSGSSRDIESVNCWDRPVTITFPYQKSFVVESFEQLKTELNNCRVDEHWDEMKILIEEDGVFFVRYSSQLAVRADIGDRINICKNMWPEIEKDGKLFRYKG